MKSTLPNLNSEQRKQVLLQWNQHQHSNHKADLDLSGHGDTLKDFAVHKGVWNPVIVSARYHASYLYYNNLRLFKDRTVLDMGTGTGLMGIVMALGGAREVVLSDISHLAVMNARENRKKFNLSDKIKVIKGDLFENIVGFFDLITFNQPFFADTPPKRDTIAASMLDDGSLLRRFFEQAPAFLNEGGIIVMPFYSKAGDTNNPAVQALQYGFEVKTTFKSVSHSGLQTGEITIHELRLKNAAHEVL